MKGGRVSRDCNPDEIGAATRREGGAGFNGENIAICESMQKEDWVKE